MVKTLEMLYCAALAALAAFAVAVQANEVNEFSINAVAESHCQVNSDIYSSCFGWSENECVNAMRVLIPSCDQNSGNYPPSGTSQSSMDAFEGCLTIGLEAMFPGLDLDSPCN